MPDRSFQLITEDRCDPGENASTVIPHRWANNVLAIRENRHPQGGWSICDTGPTISFGTHPSAYWGFPLIVPIVEGATSIVVLLSAQAVDANVTARLSTSGRLGTSQVWTAGAGYSTKALSCSIPPDVRPGETAIVEVQFQSSLGSSLGTVDLDALNSGTGVIVVRDPGASPTIPNVVRRTPCNFALTYTPSDDFDSWDAGTVYIGQYDRASASSKFLHCWPWREWVDVIDGPDAAKFTVYELGEMTVRSVAWRTSGYLDDPPVRVQDYRPGETMRAQTIYDFADAIDSTREPRVRVSQTQHPGGIGPSSRASNSYRAILAYAQVPQASDCVELVADALVTSKRTASMTLQWGTTDLDFYEQEDEFNTADLASNTALASYEVREQRGRTTEADDGVLCNLPIFGSRNLLHFHPVGSGSDSARLQRVTARIASSQVSSALTHKVWLGTSSDESQHVAVYSGHLRELRYSVSNVDGASPILPGEVIVGDPGSGPEGPNAIRSALYETNGDTLPVYYANGRQFTTVETGTGTTTVVAEHLFTVPDGPSSNVSWQITGQNLKVVVTVYDVATSTLQATWTLDTGISTATQASASGTVSNVAAGDYFLKVTIERSDPAAVVDVILSHLLLYAQGS